LLSIREVVHRCRGEPLQVRERALQFSLSARKLGADGGQGAPRIEHFHVPELAEPVAFADGCVHALGTRHDFVVVPGIEVNTDFGHTLVFGLERFVFGMHRLADLVRLVGETGGAMVGAHPYRRQLPFELRDSGDWSGALEQTLRNESYAHVSAIETYNGRGTNRQNEFSLEVCQRLGLAATAGSDAHELADVGRCATEFEAPISGLADLIAELRAGRCKPVALREAAPSPWRRLD